MTSAAILDGIPLQALDDEIALFAFMVALSGRMASLITAALVAAAVTLVIEYAAKPRLEVRKERVLMKYRARWELAKRMGLVKLHLERDKISMPITLDEDARRRFVQDLTSELRELGDALHSSQSYPPESIRGLLDYGLGYNVAALQSTLIVDHISDVSDQNRERILRAMLDQLGEALELPAEYFSLARWRVVRRVRLRRRAGREIAGHESRQSAGEAEPSGDVPDPETPGE